MSVFQFVWELPEVPIQGALSQFHMKSHRVQMWPILPENIVRVMRNL